AFHRSQSRVFFTTRAARTPLSTLSLHDALPISRPGWGGVPAATAPDSAAAAPERPGRRAVRDVAPLAVAAIATSLALWVSVRPRDRKSTRLNSSHVSISYAVFCLKKKMTKNTTP